MPAAHRTPLVRAADAERCWLHVVDDHSERAKLQRLVLRAHHEQAADLAVITELRAWRESHPDNAGIPLRSAGPRPESQDEWAPRDFAPDATHERLPGKDYESDPREVVLCSFSEGPLAELLAVREELRRALGGTLAPQLLLRLGYGSPVPATSRRPVAELLIAPNRAP